MSTQLVAGKKPRPSKHFPELRKFVEEGIAEARAAGNSTYAFGHARGALHFAVRSDLVTWEEYATLLAMVERAQYPAAA